MELKPTGEKQKLDGMGRPLAKGEDKNPFATIARAVEAGSMVGPRRGQKRRRIGADTLGATPPRDGPWSYGAADVAAAKPPKARGRQQRKASNPGLGLSQGQRLKP